MPRRRAGTRDRSGHVRSDISGVGRPAHRFDGKEGIALTVDHTIQATLVGTAAAVAVGVLIVRRRLR